MIDQVLRLSTVFANIMLASSLALSITIAVAGTVERTKAGCYGCLHTSGALNPRTIKPVLAIAPDLTPPVTKLRVAGAI